MSSSWAGRTLLKDIVISAHNFPHQITHWFCFKSNYTLVLFQVGCFSCECYSDRSIFTCKNSMCVFTNGTCEYYKLYSWDASLVAAYNKGLEFLLLYFQECFSVVNCFIRVIKGWLFSIYIWIVIWFNLCWVKSILWFSCGSKYRGRKVVTEQSSYTMQPYLTFVAVKTWWGWNQWTWNGNIFVHIITAENILAK